jgi:hypothetical protein
MTARLAGLPGRFAQRETGLFGSASMRVTGRALGCEFGCEKDGGCGFSGAALGASEYDGWHGDGLPGQGAGPCGGT